MSTFRHNGHIVSSWVNSVRYQALSSIIDFVYAVPADIRSRCPALGHPIVGVLFLLVVFMAFNTSVERLTRLPTESYFASSLVIELLRKISWPVGLIIIFSVAVLARFGYLLDSWDSLEHGRSIRIFVIMLATTIAWPLVTFGHNFYFDQTYFFDKFLLVLLLPLIWWRPAFIFLFIIPAYLLLWHLGEPSLGGSILAHKLQVTRAINVFAAAFLVYTLTGFREADRFLILLCSFVAAAYWVSALAKLNIAWIGHNHLYLMPLNAYAHGWMAFVSPEKIVEFSHSLMPFDTIMQVFVIVIEALCLVFLFARWLSISLLVMLIVFHLGVFALYGFLFWTWMALDLALIVLLVNVTRSGQTRSFGWKPFVLSVVLVGLGSWWAKPPKLGWYETPLAYNYRIETTDRLGKTTHVRPDFFGPYSDTFTFSSFSYMVEDRGVLTGAYGVTHDHEVHQALDTANDALDIFRLEQTKGAIRGNSDRAERLQEFLARFIANRALGTERAAPLRAISAPSQFWSFRGETPIVTEISEVAIVEYTSFFDGEKLTTIRRQELARLALPSGVVK